MFVGNEVRIEMLMHLFEILYSIYLLLSILFINSILYLSSFFFQNIVESLGEILFVKDWSRVFFRLWWMQMVTKKMMTVRMITTSSQPGFDAKIPHLALDGTEIEG